MSIANFPNMTVALVEAQNLIVVDQSTNRITGIVSTTKYSVNSCLVDNDIVIMSTWKCSGKLKVWTQTSLIKIHQIGSRIDGLLQKSPWNFQIIGIDSFGEEQSNGSYSGAVGLLKSHAVDFILSESTVLLRKNFFVVGAIISDPHLVQKPLFI